MWVSLFQASVDCSPVLKKISSFSVSRINEHFSTLKYTLTKQTKRAKREVDKNCVFFPYNIISVSYMRNVYDRFAVTEGRNGFCSRHLRLAIFSRLPQLELWLGCTAGCVLVQRLDSWANELFLWNAQRRLVHILKFLAGSMRILLQT